MGNRIRCKTLSGKDLELDDVVYIEQPAGDIANIWGMCGYSAQFGPLQCNDCFAKGNDIYCGKHFIVRNIHSEASPIEITILVKEFSYVGDDTKDAR